MVSTLATGRHDDRHVVKGVAALPAATQRGLVS